MMLDWAFSYTSSSLLFLLILSVFSALLQKFERLPKKVKLVGAGFKYSDYSEPTGAVIFLSGFPIVSLIFSILFSRSLTFSCIDTKSFLLLSLFGLVLITKFPYPEFCKLVPAGTLFGWQFVMGLYSKTNSLFFSPLGVGCLFTFLSWLCFGDPISQQLAQYWFSFSLLLTLVNLMFCIFSGIFNCSLEDGSWTVISGLLRVSSFGWLLTPGCCLIISVVKFKQFMTLLVYNTILMRQYRLFYLVALVAIVSPYCTDNVSCFKSKLFNFDSPPQNYYEVSIFGGGAPSIYNAMSFGDFNNDYRTDIIVVEGSVVSVYLWNNQSSQFTQASQDSCQSNSQNVLLNDFNLDGLLDFVVYSSTTSAGQMIAYLQQSPTSTNSLKFVQLMPCQLDKVQPFMADLKINNQQQLIGQLNGQRTILNYDPFLENQCQFQYLPWNSIFTNGTNQNVPFTNPHQNSFLDFTGDCQADFLMMSQNGTNTNLQFWIKNNGQYTLSTTWQFTTSTLSAVAFSDMNYDGGVDMVIMNNNQILVYYNSLEVKQFEQFCASNLVKFPYSPSSVRGFNISSLNLQAMNKQNIHIADMDSDGYPDILLLLGQLNSNVYNSYLLTNIEENGERTLGSPQKMSEFPAVSTSFFDLLQNGIYDVFIITPSFNLTVVYNNYKNPNYFFIKGYCLYGNSPDKGSIYSGASFYWVNTMDSSKKYIHMPQLYQTAYNSMQLPYVLNGLGRANNYVQQFYVGISSQNGGALQRKWTPIIPNSQLIIQTNSVVETWSIRIFILPTDSIVYVVIVTIVVLVVLGGILLGFYWKEKRQQPQFLT